MNNGHLALAIPREAYIVCEALSLAEIFE
jgi:hypothetical protein